MILVQDLTKKFSGRTVVDKINFQIRPGEIVGLLGPNGAGKTTTIRMIAGTLSPSSGRVLVDNQDLFSDEGKKSLIGYLSENNPLYDTLTVEEHLRFWAEMKQITRNRQLVISQIVDKLDLQEAYYRPMGELSKGFKQRAGLAQALLADPPILLLDEPTEGLDPNQRREIHELILGLGQDRAVIICSHVLSEINKMCQRAVIINRGKIVADDSLEHLRENPEQKKVIRLVARGEGIKEGLEKLPGVINVSPEGEEKYSVGFSGIEDLRPKIFDLAKEKNWVVLELSLRRESLEDVFAQLTST